MLDYSEPHKISLPDPGFMVPSFHRPGDAWMHVRI